MPLSEIRQTALDNFNDIFSDGLKYVKHRTLANFFIGLFKPRIDNIIKKEAPEQELLAAMWKVKKRLDVTLKKFDKIENIIEAEKLNPEGLHPIIREQLLKDVKVLVPQEFKIDESKATEILRRLKVGRM